jgi:hypothetical protein
VVIPASSMAGNGPEGCMVDQKGKQKAGNESGGYIWARMYHRREWEAGGQLECRICKKGTFSMQSGKSPYNILCKAFLHHNRSCLLVPKGC